MNNKKFYVLGCNSLPKGDSGESIGGKYDLSSACSYCGTKARLIGSLYTKGIQKIQRDFFYTLSNDCIISEDLFRKLIFSQINLGNSSQVVDQRGNALPYYHLNPSFYFPKALAASTGLITDKQCPLCKQDGFFSDVIVGNFEKNIPTYVTPIELHYDEIPEDFLNQSDVFNSWEHLGRSNLIAEKNKVIGYARPLLIVSEKLRVAFEEEKIKDVSFSPVFINRNNISMYDAEMN